MAELDIITASTSYTETTKKSGKKITTTYPLTVRCYANYTLTESATSATITSSLVLGYTSSGTWRDVEIYEDPATSFSPSGDWKLNNDSIDTLRFGKYQKLPYTISRANKTATITKTHSAQSIPVYVALYGVKVSANYTVKDDYSSIHTGYTTHSRTVSLSNSKTAYITIPAKASYAVTYNTNGGQNPPASQTKWYGETLTLSTAQPVKDGYTFKGWATSAENASAGTVDYASGASYTGNAALTLYAVWELTYQKPTIYKLTVERCQSDGTLDDEGSYALVSFDWAVFRSAESRYYGGNTYPYADNSVETCTVTVGTQRATPTLTGASGHSSVIVGVGSYDVDTAYDATVSITDSQEISTDNTTTVSGSLPLAFFPMDYNADATAVGFFMPAPNDGSGAYFAKEVTLKNKLYIELDDNAGSGTDFEIIQALTDLGWDDLLS